jgi:hypothetical protein
VAELLAMAMWFMEYVALRRLPEALCLASEHR